MEKALMKLDTRRKENKHIFPQHSYMYNDVVIDYDK